MFLLIKRHYNYLQLEVNCHEYMLYKIIFDLEFMHDFENKNIANSLPPYWPMIFKLVYD